MFIAIGAGAESRAEEARRKNEKPAVTKVGRRVFGWCPDPDTGGLKSSPPGAARNGARRSRASVSADLGDGVEVALVAAGLLELVALGEHAVELVHEEIDALVAIVAGDGRVEVGAVH